MVDVAIMQNVGGSVKSLTNAEKVIELSKCSGLDEPFAKDFLASTNWDLQEAIKAYKSILEDTFADDSLQVNVEKPSTTSLPQASKHHLNRPRMLNKGNRGISVSNLQIVKQAREGMTLHIDEKDFPVFDSSSRKNFVLPDLSKFEHKLAAFIRDDLITDTTLRSLCNAGCLNWWAELGACRKLFPLSTVGDGNCLLHAASLGMWGFHDRMLILRNSLHSMFLHPRASKAVKRRWMYSTWVENRSSSGLVFSPTEWKEEWNEVVKLASDRPKRYDSTSPTRRFSRNMSFRTVSKGGEVLPTLYEGESLDSLESIHIYMLANLLCRPIIVVAEEMLKDREGNDVSPIPFGGIYLPLQREPDICCKFPFVMAYHASHFSTLVPAFNEEERLVSSVPLVDRHFRMLPLRFATDPGVTWSLIQDDSMKNELPEPTFAERLGMLRKYLDVVQVKIPAPCKTPGKGSDTTIAGVSSERHESKTVSNSDGRMILATRMNLKDLPMHYNEMISNYITAITKRFHESRSDDKPVTLQGTSPPKLPPRPSPPRKSPVDIKDISLENVASYCRAIGCKFYGSRQTNNYCSSCYREHCSKT